MISKTKQEKVFIHGILNEEVKNRFLCSVNINGANELCYIPSSCRLSNFLQMKNRKVLLVPVTSHKARTRYSVYAIKVGRRYIPVNLSGINSVVKEQLSRRCFAFLGARRIVRRECFVEGYKCDLYLPESRTVIEIKSILSFEEQASFPAVYSERAIHQLRLLEGLLDKGYRVCYLFVSLTPSVRTIYPNDLFTDFTKEFNNCVLNGMLVYGLTATIKGNDINIGRRICVDLGGRSNPIP